MAEDRDLLLAPDAGPLARARYRDYYSVGRLRSLAEARRGGPHPDLYRTLRLVCGQLRGGCAALGLPALGGFLFSPAATPSLDAADLANHDLLSALRELAFTEEGRARRPVDYKNLGSEELGSVYESLLELHPQLNTDAGTFELASAAGSERKTTGSYYTAGPLISTLLDSALEPVIAARLEGKRTRAEQEQALLSIKVVDPASGSGHFLIMAAHRLARHLARIRTGDEEPSPAALRAALRDVVRHCIYGVDINPMAVELCKVALWMETLDPGKPLSFLDRNIQCGNSLIGASPQGLEDGIPDAAFAPVTGDDKAYCSEFKKLNKKEREQQALFTRDLQPWERLGNLAAGMAQLDATADDTLAGVQRQEAMYEELVRSSDYRYGRLLADAWCAAFVWQKTKAFAYPITEQVFRAIERNPFNLTKWMEEEIGRLAGQYQFFHWHLAFPHVFTLPRTGEEADNETAGWCGGFDVVCGNPPWEKINLKDEEFFAQTHPEIANAPTKAMRKKLIEVLQKTDPDEHIKYEQEQAFHDRMSMFFRGSNRFPFTGVSRINLYSIFAELATQLLSARGRSGMVIASGIATDDNNKELFASLVQNRQLISVWDFENREGIFPAVDSRYKFCLLSTGGSKTNQPAADFTFYLTNVNQLSEPERHFSLTFEELSALNPNTHTAPTFRNQHEARIVSGIYGRVRAWCLHELEKHWPGVPKTPFNMSNDSGLFYTKKDLLARGARFSVFRTASLGNDRFLPFYESKLIHQFNHRYATFEGCDDQGIEDGQPQNTRLEHLKDHSFCIESRYWLDADTQTSRFPGDWFLVYRMTARANDERTSIAAVIPGYPCGHTLSIITELGAVTAALLTTNLNSIVYDFVSRVKVPGASFGHWIWKQLPTLGLSQYASTTIAWHDRSGSEMWFLSRCLELTYTAWDLQPFARDCGYDGPPFRWDEDRRFLLRCELDAAFLHMYGIARPDVDYIMDTFPIVRRKDEAAHGEFRTKRVILEIYDEMADAMRSVQPYCTRLDPPPADPRVAHPPREGAGWRDAPMDSRNALRLAQVVENGPTYRPTIRPTAPAPAEPEPDTGQRDLFGEPVAPASQPVKAKPAPPKSEPAAQPVLIFAPPQGSYTERLSRIMALRAKGTPEAIGEVVAALGDEDERIRWLAGSVLQSIGGETVVATLRAFARQAPSAVARDEAEKVLGKLTEGR